MKILSRIKYILYKLINNLFFSIYFPNKLASLNANNFGYFFDLSHSTTHLGDRLFFFPLISYLIEHKKKVFVSSKDKVSAELFSALYGRTLKSINPLARSDLTIIIPQASFINYLVKFYNRSLMVIKYNKNSRKSVVEQNFAALGLNLTDLATYLPKQPTKSINKKIIIFSNYIDSGFFRKWFVDERKLVRKCIYYREQGFDIWHVGTEKDKQNDKKKYEFVDRDLRGKLTIRELVSVVQKFNVKIVTYDNFIMHLGHIFNRKTKVLFRGRFSKKAYDFHIKSVNESLARKKGLIEYL